MLDVFVLLPRGLILAVRGIFLLDDLVVSVDFVVVAVAVVDGMTAACGRISVEIGV